jgi:hypothetical protein
MCGSSLIAARINSDTDTPPSLARRCQSSSSWGYHAPRLERALEHLPRGKTRARRIIGLPPKLTRLASGYLVDDRYVVDDQPRHRPSGGLRYGPQGRVLSVR